MNVLALVQEFCGKKTLPVPGAVVGSTDTGIVQIRYILAEAVRELAEFSWQEQVVEKTFTSIAAENQGAVTTLLGADFVSIIPETFWDLNEARPITGPVNDTQWAAMKAIPITGPINYWRIIGNQLRIFPIMSAGHSLRLSYTSKYSILSAGGTLKESITADDDTFLIPDLLIARSLDYRWKRQKGEPWEADYNDFLGLLPKKLADKGMPVLSMDSPSTDIQPGIWVPAGSWHTV
jgi:hypothetical protein